MKRRTDEAVRYLGYGKKTADERTRRMVDEAFLELEQAARKSIDLTRTQYLNGYISYLDMLDAQRTYLDAQIALSNAVRDKQIALVQLYKALGGGWE